MSRIGDFDYLLGTHVTLDPPSPSPPQTFVLEEILSEEYQRVTQHEYDRGDGHPFAAIKFSCRNVADRTQQGFMRIYYQIPVDGTFRSPPEVRARQALHQRTHAELKALTSLDNADCTAVPQLLGLSEMVQVAQDYVPGGYINYIAWARVPGEPIDFDSYWEGDLKYRNEVRAIFRATYEELNRCHWEPRIGTPDNLIYDDIDSTMHIAGFRDPVETKEQPFSDVTYACWGLARPSDRIDWDLDSSDWRW